MQQFVVAWVGIEIDGLSRKCELKKIRIEDVTESVNRYMKVQFYLSDDIVSFSYAYWENMDFSRALGQMVEFLFDKYNNGLQIEKVPNKPIYDFCLPKESWGK